MNSGTKVYQCEWSPAQRGAGTNSGKEWFMWCACAERKSKPRSAFTGQGRGRRSRPLRNAVRLFITPTGARAAPHLWRNNHAHDHQRTMTPIDFWLDLTHHQSASGYTAFTAWEIRWSNSCPNCLLLLPECKIWKLLWTSHKLTKYF